MSNFHHKMQIYSRVVNFFGDSAIQIVQNSQGGPLVPTSLKGETPR